MIRLRQGFLLRVTRYGGRDGGQARAVTGIAAAVLITASLSAQQPPQPTFRAGVELVQIDAVVTDRDGNPVSGLTVDDFELREVGKPRDISAFATVDIPIERAERVLYSPTAIEPDVASNGGPEGRVYIITFDDVEATLALRTRHFFRRFVETQMGANDVAAIAYLGKGAANSQDFTGNKRLLLTRRCGRARRLCCPHICESPVLPTASAYGWLTSRPGSLEWAPRTAKQDGRRRRDGTKSS
jgi:hypothetical protein